METHNGGHCFAEDPWMRLAKESSPLCLEDWRIGASHHFWLEEM